MMSRSEDETRCNEKRTGDLLGFRRREEGVKRSRARERVLSSAAARAPAAPSFFAHFAARHHEGKRCVDDAGCRCSPRHQELRLPDGALRWKRRNDGIFIINVGKTYEKLKLAARVIAAIENPQDILVQSARPSGQRVVLKFAQYTGCQAIAGRHTPGTFTNQLQNTFREPSSLSIM